MRALLTERRSAREAARAGTGAPIAPFDGELVGVTDDPHDRKRFERRREFVEVLGRRRGMPTAEDVIITTSCAGGSASIGARTSMIA